ncbi:hypothetical protein [Chamaesiphon sp. VAR_48_metabat_135_sub]|uniref:hypothetical protein n=1 Tax=Chamaesiphon sp. VAR_48_metabat_135_sub TaxID=2964699 RepID=UPI00286BF93C|nr:hypothetical protein [Chamaesiphon sp. VAR_48_metabat_135_sub]
MQTTNSDRSAQAIEMSAVARAKWLTMLKTRKINTAKQLLSRVRDLHGEPLARKALKGDRLDRMTWDSIFKGLKVYREDFFNDIEWFERDLETQWGMLWGMATDASDRFGIVLPEHIPDSSLWDGVGSDKFQQSIASRTSVLLEIPWGTPGYLILLEQDALENIVLLCPSPLMANPLLTGKIQRLPQYPPSTFEFLQPITVGTNYLWAGVFTQLPDLRWLADAQKRPLRLQLTQLADLFNFASKQPKGTPMFRSSYVVTD